MTSLQDDMPLAFPTTLALTGEVDLANAGVILRAARIAVREGFPEFVLDLSEVTFMDSQGLKAMLGARQELREAGATLVVHNPSRSVLQLLAITGLDGVFDVT